MPTFLFNAVATRRSLFFALLSLLALARILRAAPTATQPDEKPLARLALLGDPHVSLDPKFAQYVVNFQHVIADVNAANVDAVLIAGDLTQSGDAPSLHRFKEMIAAFHAKVWCVAGNHDVGQKPLDDKPATVTNQRIAQFESIVGPEHFAEDILPNIHLVAITSSLFSSGIDREEPQWQFLQKELTEKRPGITLLLTHYPPYAVKPDEARGYFNMEPPSRSRLLSLLQTDTGGTKIILSAHLHRPILHDWQGITDIGAPAISFGIPAGTQRVGWTLISLHNNSPADATLHYPNIPGTPPAPPPNPPPSSQNLPRPQP
jgi:Icc-related predicted phosphoesterase